MFDFDYLVSSSFFNAIPIKIKIQPRIFKAPSNLLSIKSPMTNVDTKLMSPSGKIYFFIEVKSN